MKKTSIILIISITLISIMAACQPSLENIPENTITSEVIAFTETTVPFTPTVTITKTKAPTSTPKPTNTKIPTSTSTSIPDPIEFRGNGDNILDLDWPYGIAIVQITGNSGSNHFAVKSLDENNETLDLLVNTTDVYDGTKLINLRDGEVVKRFEVSASGEWLITVKPISEIQKVNSPGEIMGIGDDAFALPNSCDKLEISGNDSSHYFGIVAYSGSEGRTLLVNTTDPYQGTVLCPGQTILIVVTSSLDPWVIKLY